MLLIPLLLIPPLWAQDTGLAPPPAGRLDPGQQDRPWLQDAPEPDPERPASEVPS